MDYKICFTCKQLLPAIPEYFNRDSQKSDGFRPSCKECRNKKRSEDYAINPEQRAKAQERAKQWAMENPERHKATNRKNYLKNRENRIEYSRQWREDNPELYQKQCSGKWQRFSDKQKQQVVASVRNRRARIKHNGGTHTANDIQERLEEQGYMCFYCGYPLENDYQVDHFYPLAKGGSNDAENLVIACPSCNKSKCDKDPHEFILQVSRRGGVTATLKIIW